MFNPKKIFENVKPRKNCDLVLLFDLYDFFEYFVITVFVFVVSYKNVGTTI